ncbi:hypothetical protein EJ05DRAFT_474444 [Pseudovirgaria hyperparasitica]|uniref:Uncharacterized protein n=1 Tax=Pseudovirgaria hyperparasitica TaxID=470096 RepID=A0A6A6WHF5_9PEZI|nr:uncharacterized protein EJ05DRAFT_474444 [Pseudovirgaria hyperparasitica]KAF2760581.1 hypothetical protein EJ05DRAFT_474444 [Pseudovirgaria hyperparasitica]
MSRQLAGQRRPSPQELLGCSHGSPPNIFLDNYEITRSSNANRRQTSAVSEGDIEHGGANGLKLASLPTSLELSRSRSRGTSPGKTSHDSQHKRPLSPKSRPSVPVDIPQGEEYRSGAAAPKATVESGTLNVPLGNVHVQTRASYGSTVNGESEPRAYAEWRDLDSSWKRNIVVSNVIAFFLQWGVTGAAVVIAYNTPAYGIGCRPSSYLLYAILATAAHILLFISVFLSHEVMLNYQNGSATITCKSPRNYRVYIVSALAVMTRITGKAIAIANTFWIILSSLFELVGLYNSCFCEASMLIPKATSWVLLFSSQSGELRHNAGRYWAGGIVMSALVCMITCWIVYLYRTRA